MVLRLPVVLASLVAEAPVVAAHELTCSSACGIFLDQGLDPHPLHWQADSQPLDHSSFKVTRVEESTSHVTLNELFSRLSGSQFPHLVIQGALRKLPATTFDASMIPVPGTIREFKSNLLS